MPEQFVNNVRLRRVEGRRVVSYVLRAKEDAVGKRLQEDARGDESGDGLQPEAAYLADARGDFAQLRYRMARKV